jgi:NAD(P)-dependent dehydrogenase (short-subunit alcohol dehydrogenase family)
MSKTVLITGAGAGFGRDAAVTLANAGHTVFASMRDPRGRGRDQAEALRQQGVEVVEIDVADDASVESGVKAVFARAGRIDVLVNNASIAAAGVTEAFTSDQAKIVLDTNVVGVLRASCAVLPIMRAQREGLIVNIGSILGRVTFPLFGIYGASKFAVEAITDSLRYEVSPFGVEVVLVQLSEYPTPMYASIQQPANPARAATYGEIGEFPGKMFERFMGMFAALDAPGPHDVATEVAELVAAPRGGRPPRLVVGRGFGADAVNEAVEPIQRRVIEGLGLGALALSPARDAARWQGELRSSSADGFPSRIAGKCVTAVGPVRRAH